MSPVAARRVRLGACHAGRQHERPQLVTSSPSLVLVNHNNQAIKNSNDPPETNSMGIGYPMMKLLWCMKKKVNLLELVKLSLLEEWVVVLLLYSLSSPSKQSLNHHNRSEKTKLILYNTQWSLIFHGMTCPHGSGQLGGIRVLILFFWDGGVTPCAWLLIWRYGIRKGAFLKPFSSDIPTTSKASRVGAFCHIIYN